MKRILEDIRVLDFTHVWFGPYCTQLLAELGAEVILIEPPWGNIGRLGPGELFKGTSSSFYALNQNKRGIAIDMKNPEGVNLAKELVEHADILVENYVPGVMERLGLGYNEVRKINPKIIYAALSGFGQTGPYREYASYAVVAEAISGHSYATGKNIDYEGQPRTMAGAIGDIGPGTMAAFAIMAALRHRDRTGEGQFIDVNQVDTMVSFNTCSTTDYSIFGEPSIERRRKKEQSGDPSSSPRGIWGIIPVKDGWVQVAGSRPKAMEALKAYLGVEEVKVDEVKEKLKSMTRKEAFEWLVNFGFPAAPIYAAHESMEDPHIKDHNMFVEVNHPIAGKYKTPNFPAHFSATPGEVTSASPILGQHTANILKKILGKTDAEIIGLENKGVIAQWKP